MNQIRCSNCKNMIKLKEPIKRGVKAVCKCGHTYICLNKDEYISRWRRVSTSILNDKI